MERSKISAKRRQAPIRVIKVSGQPGKATKKQENRKAEKERTDQEEAEQKDRVRRDNKVFSPGQAKGPDEQQAIEGGWS